MPHVPGHGSWSGQPPGPGTQPYNQDPETHMPYTPNVFIPTPGTDGVFGDDDLGLYYDEDAMNLSSLFSNLDGISSDYITGERTGGGRGGGSQVSELDPMGTNRFVDMNLNPYLTKNVFSFKHGGRIHDPYNYGGKTPKYNYGGVTHTMPDGTIHPGATHEDYIAMMNRSGEKMSKYTHGGIHEQQGNEMIAMNQIANLLGGVNSPYIANKGMKYTKYDRGGGYPTFDYSSDKSNQDMSNAYSAIVEKENRVYSDDMKQPKLTYIGGKGFDKHSGLPWVEATKLYKERSNEKYKSVMNSLEDFKHPNKNYTFKEAFNQARSSFEKTFMHNGKKYTTRLAEETKKQFERSFVKGTPEYKAKWKEISSRRRIGITGNLSTTNRTFTQGGRF